MQSRTLNQTNGNGALGSPGSSRETSPARSSGVGGLTETQALEQFRCGVSASVLEANLTGFFVDSKAYHSERDFSQHPHKAVFFQVIDRGV